LSPCRRGKVNAGGRRRVVDVAWSWLVWLLSYRRRGEVDTGGRGWGVVAVISSTWRG